MKKEDHNAVPDSVLTKKFTVVADMLSATLEYQGFNPKELRTMSCRQSACDETSLCCVRRGGYAIRCFLVSGLSTRITVNFPMPLKAKSHIFHDDLQYVAVYKNLY